MAAPGPEDSKGQKRPQSWLSEGIVLAATPFVGYMGAYVRERGFADYFAIPHDLIEVTLRDVLAFSFSFVAAVALVVLVGDFLFAAIGREEEPIRRPALIFLALFGLVILEIPLFQFSLEHWEYWGVPLAVAVVSIVYIFIAPRLKRGLFRSAELPRDEQSGDLRAHTVLDALTDRFGPGFVVLLVYILAAGWASWSIGRAEAINRVDYLVPTGNPEAVVLRIYGDTVIAADLDRRTHLVGSHFVIWKVSEQRAEFDLLPIGPLRGALRS